jgi:hypothetical protein
MPTITEAVQTGFAHCTNPRCPGHDQEEVQIVRRETAFGYDENGGNLPGFERSFVNVGFYNDGTDGKPDESVCPYCHGHREATDQARRQYEPLSGHDPKGLLAVARFDAAKQAELRAGARLQPGARGVRARAPGPGRPQPRAAAAADRDRGAAGGRRQGAGPGRRRPAVDGDPPAWDDVDAQ